MLINDKYSHDIDSILKIFNESVNKSISYLIYGAPGSGKSYLSSIIAKKIYRSDVCHNSFVLNEDSRENQAIISVNDIRKIKKWLNLSTIDQSSKLVIIDDAHKMNVNSSNALLKILEEPIGKTTIILNASNIESLEVTVKSRCIKLKLRKKSFQEFEKILFEYTDSYNFENIAELYKICSGDLKLAIAIIKDEALHDLNDIKDKNDKFVEFISKLNLEKEEHLKIFSYLVYNFLNYYIDNLVMYNQNFIKILLNGIDKIEYLFSNMQNLNSTYVRDIIINILIKCNSFSKKA
ncbi:MAG: DNA polymerase-3 subunit delta' [Candidatus Midichloriaceae bacterium]|jgi:DNA polymerase-3 subunit delta'